MNLTEVTHQNKKLAFYRFEGYCFHYFLKVFCSFVVFSIRIKPKTKKKMLFIGLNTSVLVLFSKSLVFKLCLVFEFAKSSFGIWIRIWGYTVILDPPTVNTMSRLMAGFMLLLMAMMMMMMMMMSCTIIFYINNKLEGSNNVTCGAQQYETGSLNNSWSHLNIRAPISSLLQSSLSLSRTVCDLFFF